MSEYANIRLDPNYEDLGIPYFPERDYRARDYKPFGEPTKEEPHFCTRCQLYYRNLARLGITTDFCKSHNNGSSFLPTCMGDASHLMKDLTVDDFEGDIEAYHEALVVSDPVAWAEVEFGWKARWYQKEMLRCTSQFKGTRAGRRVGKTEAMAVKALHSAWTNSRFEVLIIAPYQPQVMKLFEMLRRFIGESVALRASVQIDRESPFQQITFQNGSTIRGFSSGSKTGARSDKVRGQTGDLIILDEVDYLDDADIEVIAAILASEPDTQIMGSSTPTGIRQKLWSWCFEAGTPVMTPMGERPIESLRIGDAVLGCSGIPEKVTQVFDHHYRGQMVELSFKKLSRTLKSTSEHPHLVKKGNCSPKWVPACEVSVGDWVGLTLPRQTHCKIPRPEFQTGDMGLSRSERPDAISKILRDGGRGLADDRRGQSYERALQALDWVEQDRDRIKRFLRVVGIFAGEGSYLADGRGISLAFRRDEKIGQEVRQFFDLMSDAVGGGKTKIETLSNGRGEWDQVTAFGSYLPLIMDYLVGRGCSTKRFHDGLMTHKLRGYLFEGYMDADGHERKNGSLALVTKSPYLADQALRHYASFDAAVSCKERDGYWEVYVSLNPTNQVKWFEGMPFYMVEDVVCSKFEGRVYNIETGSTHTYSANGFATHNCIDKTQRFKEFWFVSSESPSWNEETEHFFKTMYSASGYMREFNAEFGQEMAGVFRPQDIDNCIKKYTYKDCTYHENCRYIIGVDWNNPVTGTHIVVVEARQNQQLGVKYKAVHKEIVRRSEFTQHFGVKRIIELSKKWHADYIYVDAGYGETQVEMLKKFDVDNPKEQTRLKQKVKSIQMNQNILIRDPGTGLEVKKPAKQFMVTTTARELEVGRIEIPYVEDTQTRILEDEIAIADIGLLQQMRAFKVEKVSPTGVPRYSDGFEHTLTAFMLAIMGFSLEFSDIRRMRTSRVSIERAGGLGIKSTPNDRYKVRKERMEQRERLQPQERSGTMGGKVHHDIDAERELWEENTRLPTDHPHSAEEEERRKMESSKRKKRVFRGSTVARISRRARRGGGRRSTF